jgi:hypothetical protein
MTGHRATPSRWWFASLALPGYVFRIPVSFLAITWDFDKPTGAPANRDIPIRGAPIQSAEQGELQRDREARPLRPEPTRIA